MILSPTPATASRSPTVRRSPRARALPEFINGWRVGTSLPAEYYVDEKRYLTDERFIADNVWLMVDHESRIPKPGDYFVFEFGRGDSVIILRDQAGEVKGFHNVCRHRGSRLCRHNDAPADKDPRLSVKQLGASGNTPVFRCPYHAWTYGMDGRLISAPNGMPSDFDFSQNGLIPCHVRTAGGFIIANLSKDAPPDFESVVNPARTPNWRTICEDYGTATLKIAARARYPVAANWKLVMENFHECYHCGPAHKSLVKAHPFWDGTMSAEQHQRLAKELERFVPTNTASPRHRAGRAAAGNDSRRSRAGPSSISGLPPDRSTANRSHRSCRRKRSTRTIDGPRARPGRWGTSSVTTTTSRWCGTHRVTS